MVLAIDYGLRRVGVARSDETRSLAIPVGTLSRTGDRSLARELAQLAQTLAAVEWVLGWPLRDDATSTPVLAGIRRLAHHLRRESRLPVVLVDESGSSQVALAQGGDRDAEAAAEILRRYLAEGAMAKVET